LAATDDLTAFAPVARSPRFMAWLDAETLKYTTALIYMTEADQIRVLQGRLQQLDRIRKLCEASGQT
jgi:hypothetical protein